MKRIIATAMLLLAAITWLPAQQPPAGAAKQPAPKSQKEVQALQALFGAQDPDSRIKAADALITGFADTEFKDIALYLAAVSYQQKGDPAKAEVYAERTLQANPKHYQAMLLMSELIAQRTREHDLDREEKLGRAEKYANQAIELLKTAPKPNPNVTDEQWEAGKKDLTAQAHQALGLIALSRKKYDVAISELKTAVESASSPEPAFQVRLAQAYSMAGKNDEAVALCDKILASPNLHPQIKAVTEKIKEEAVKAKAGGAKPAAPSAPKQVEIKP